MPQISPHQHQSNEAVDQMASMLYSYGCEYEETSLLSSDGLELTYNNMFCNLNIYLRYAIIIFIYNICRFRRSDISHIDMFSMILNLYLKILHNVLYYHVLRVVDGPQGVTSASAVSSITSIRNRTGTAPY